MTILYKNNKKKGFTLIELLFTITILSIVSVISIPFYEEYVNNSLNEQAKVDLMNFAFELEAHKKKNYSYSSAIENGKFKDSFNVYSPRNSENPKYIFKPYLFPTNSDRYLVKAEKLNGSSNEALYIYQIYNRYIGYYEKDGRLSIWMSR